METVIPKEYELFLVEIESPCGDGDTKRVQNIYSVILEETEPSCRDTKIEIKATGQRLREDPVSI